MLPAQRRQELQQLAVHRLAGLDQPLDGALQVHRVPQHDSRRHQVEAAGPVALLLEAPIPDFPKAVEEHRPGQRVARLTFVQAGTLGNVRIGPIPAFSDASPATSRAST